MCATGNPPLYIHTCVHVHGSVSLGTQAHDVPKVACFTVNVYGVYINKATLLPENASQNDAIFAQSLFMPMQNHLAMVKFLWLHNHPSIIILYIYIYIYIHMSYIYSLIELVPLLSLLTVGWLECISTITGNWTFFYVLWLLCCHYLTCPATISLHHST